jgi:hypothetical protein
MEVSNPSSSSRSPRPASLIAVGLLALALGRASPASAQVSVSLAGGLNTCVEGGGSGCDRIESCTCTHVDFSGLGGLGVFYEVLPKLHTGLGLRFGALGPGSSTALTDQSISTFHVMPTALWIEPMSPKLNLEGRLGFGYGSSTHSYKSADGSANGTSWVSWATVDLGLAFSLKVMDKLHAGMGVDYFLQGGGTRCTESIGSICKEQKDEVSNLLQSVVFARYQI